MRAALLIFFLGLLLMTGACSTPDTGTGEVFHGTNNSSIVIESLNERKVQLLAPNATRVMDAPQMLDLLQTMGPRQTAILVLENYSEPQLGTEFRDRTMGWFLGLRGLGYKQIIILRGTGEPSLEGRPILAEYN